MKDFVCTYCLSELNSPLLCLVMPTFRVHIHLLTTINCDPPLAHICRQSCIGYNCSYAHI